jgi:hypothetical protein
MGAAHAQMHGRISANIFEIDGSVPGWIDGPEEAVRLLEKEGRLRRSFLCEKENGKNANCFDSDAHALESFQLDLLEFEWNAKSLPRAVARSFFGGHSIEMAAQAYFVADEN